MLSNGPIDKFKCTVEQALNIVLLDKFIVLKFSLKDQMSSSFQALPRYRNSDFELICAFQPTLSQARIG